MSIQYRIYANGGTGGPPDLSSPVATVSTLSHATGALSAGTWRFLVRAYDTASGLEEQNTDEALLVIGSGGVDLTGRPAPVRALHVAPMPGGKARVSWSTDLFPVPQPTGFKVYVGTPTPSFASPAATVAFAPGRDRHGTTSLNDLSGLTDGVDYAVAVRAYNASGESADSETVHVVGNSAAPDPVDAVSAEAVP